MGSAPLIIDAQVRAELAALRELAAAHPVDMQQLVKTISTPEGKRRHLAQMTVQSVEISGPWPFFVTLSLETGHGAGTCRHMSMSIMRKGRVPSLEAVWMVAEILGFWGGLSACAKWIEDLSDGGAAINVVQPVRLMQAAGHG